MSIAEKYFEAQRELFDHVGFVPDWVEYAIDDATEYYWRIEGTQLTEQSVKYAETPEQLDDEEGNYYRDEVYTQRFYSRWVYEGEEVTMIFCNPGVDGINWFKVFDNKKRRK